MITSRPATTLRTLSSALLFFSTWLLAQEAPAEQVPTPPVVIEQEDQADQDASAQSSPALEAAPALQQAESKRWKVRDAHLILGAERLSNVGWYNYDGFQDGEKVGKFSRSEVNLLGPPRLSVDFSWIGTIGLTFGYVGDAMSGENFANGQRSSIRTQGVLIGARGGVLFDVGRYLSVWLRAGYQYQYARQDPGGGSDVIKTDQNSFVFDPRLVITPVPHVGLSIGPYVQFDAVKDKTDYGGYIDPPTSRGVQGGLSLDLYGFLGG